MIIFLKVLAVLGLVFLNGFFVASEFAIVKIRETRLIELAESGNLRARVADTLVRNLDAYLSATQLGITIASLGLGWMGEPLVAHQLEPLLHKMGITNETAISSISFATGFTIITFLHIVFGELAPKSLAIRRTEGTTLWISIPLRVFYWTFFPVIWILNEAAIGVLRVMGVNPATGEEISHSQAELLMILSESARGGLITEQGKRISSQALDLASRQARQIMVPRNEIVYFCLTDSLEDNLKKARSNSFARYPLCEGDLDTVLGIVHIRDMLWMLQDGKSEDLKKIAHELILVSESDPLEKILQRFRDTHIHLALVVDDTGSVSGLVTLEDVIEQLVGQIQDEFDRETPLLKKLSDTSWEVSGRAPLRLLQQRLHVEFGPADAVTVSGYLTEKLGRFPAAGDELVVDGWKIEVSRMDALKVRTCRFVVNKPEDPV